MDMSENQKNSPVIIGVSGVTNGGKTTLCDKLLELFPRAHLIPQDRFFKEEEHLNWVNEVDHANWDELIAVNNEALLNEVVEWCDRQSSSSTSDVPLLIIEGFLIFNYKPLLQFFTKKYFFTLPFEESKRRRNTRVYTPPDPPGYFDIVAYPMYLKNKEEMEMLNNGDIEYLDGTHDQKTILNRVVRDIQLLLSS